MNTLIWTILCILIFVTQTGCGAPPTTPPGGLSIPSIAADPNSGGLLPPEGNSGPLDPNPPENGPDSGQNGSNPGDAGGGSSSGDSGAAGGGGGQNLPPQDPPAGPLNCYVNNGVYCMDGNVQNGPVQINVNSMFLGNNPTLQIVQASVTNGNNATQTQICSQPNGAGCHANSACITAVIHVKGTNQTFPPTMLCGNAVNLATNVLQML